MIRNTYWNDPWEREPERRSTPSGQAKPQQAAVQQTAPRQTSSAPQSAQSSAADTPPLYVYPDKTKKKGHGCLIGLLIFLLLLALSLGAGVFMLMNASLSIEQLMEEIGIDVEWYDEDRQDNDTEAAADSSPEEESADPDEEADEDSYCSLERAEIGADVSIQVVSWADMQELSYEEVYAQNISSIVSVVCYLSDLSGATGTGIIIHKDGYIVTNAHVIEDAVECLILLEDNSYYSAALVGLDEETDLAVLKIDATGLSAACFGDSDELVVGNACVAIGDPLGIDFRGTMTTGIISALNRNVEVNGYDMTLIQTDCAINSGNSGGPLINMYGLVVGICNMKMMSSATTVEGLGFAIPSNTIKTVVNKLIARGEVQKAMLGITAQTLTTAQCKSYGIDCGILVVTVSASSDAYAQGIRSGDVIVAAEGVPISTVTQLNNLKADMYPGDSITLTVLREGEYLDFRVLLMDEAAVY